MLPVRRQVGNPALWLSAVKVVERRENYMCHRHLPISNNSPAALHVGLAGDGLRGTCLDFNMRDFAPRSLRMSICRWRLRGSGLTCLPRRSCRLELPVG